MAVLTPIRTANISFALKVGGTIFDDPNCRTKVFSVLPNEIYYIRQTGGHWCRVCFTKEDPVDGVTIFSPINATQGQESARRAPYDCKYLLVYYSYDGDLDVNLTVKGTPGNDGGTPTPTISTITFNANGGTGAPSPVSGNINSWITIPNETPTKNGFTFEGWSTTLNGEAEYQPNSRFWGDKESITLYAVWQKNATAQTYKIEYDANGGYPTPSSQTKQHDVPIQITSEKPQTYDGRTFSGWSTKRVGNVEYHSGDWYNQNANLYLHAIYNEEIQPTTCTVTFNANGGTGAPAQITGQLNSSVSIPNTIPKKDKYRFMGWSLQNDNTAEYQPGNSITLNATSITLYAVWSLDSQLNRTMYLGEQLISNVYLGSSYIGTIYLGDKKIW